MTIRAAIGSDVGPITEIYNEAIANTTATFDTEPKTLEQQQVWLDGHSARLPVLVAETDDCRVVGWASLSAWSDRCAYADTAEVSIYLAPEARGQGLGRELMSALVFRARVARLHVLLARVAEGNEASLRMFKHLGFEPIGTMRQVGSKFGRRWDVHMLQLTFLA